MTARPRLIRSIPFWVLLAGSLALTGVGAWLVADRVGKIGAGVLSQTPEGAIEVYAGPSVAVAGAVMMGAGLVGILLALSVATIATLRPQPAVEVVEPIDWSAESDESGSAEEVFRETEQPVTAAPAAAEPVAAESAEPAAEPARTDTDGETPGPASASPRS